MTLSKEKIKKQLRVYNPNKSSRLINRRSSISAIQSQLPRFEVQEIPFMENFYFLIEDNCFTEFCCFLSNINITQPQVYMCSLPLEPPSPSHPSRLIQSPFLSSLSHTNFNAALHKVKVLRDPLIREKLEEGVGCKPVSHCSDR